MATTTNFGPVTLQPGARTFGPHHAADAESLVALTVDRTVTGGLNSLAGDSGLFMEAQMSNDGGVTWHAVDSGQPGSTTQWGTIGGPITHIDKVTGLPVVYTASAGTWPLFPGTGRLLQAVVTVTGPSAVTVSGSITTS